MNFPFQQNRILWHALAFHPIPQIPQPAQHADAHHLAAIGGGGADIVNGTAGLHRETRGLGDDLVCQFFPGTARQGKCPRQIGFRFGRVDDGGRDRPERDRG